MFKSTNVNLDEMERQLMSQYKGMLDSIDTIGAQLEAHKASVDRDREQLKNGKGFGAWWLKHILRVKL